MREVRPRKRAVLVAVCGECSGAPKALRAALRGELKAHGQAKTVRVVKTSCLDICPKRKTAIAVSRDDAPPGSVGARYFVVARDVDPAAVIAKIGALEGRARGPLPDAE